MSWKRKIGVAITSVGTAGLITHATLTKLLNDAIPAVQENRLAHIEALENYLEHDALEFYTPYVEWIDWSVDETRAKEFIVGLKNMYRQGEKGYTYALACHSEIPYESYMWVWKKECGKISACKIMESAVIGNEQGWLDHEASHWNPDCGFGADDWTYIIEEGLYNARFKPSIAADTAFNIEKFLFEDPPPKLPDQVIINGILPAINLLLL